MGKFKEGDEVIDIDSGEAAIIVVKDARYHRQIGLKADDIPLKFVRAPEGTYDERYFPYNWRRPNEIRKLTKLEKTLK